MFMIAMVFVLLQTTMLSGFFGRMWTLLTWMSASKNRYDFVY